MSIKFNTKQNIVKEYETIKLNYIYFEPNSPDERVTIRYSPEAKSRLHQYQWMRVSASLGTFDVNGKFNRLLENPDKEFEFKDAEVEEIFTDALTDIQAGKTVSRAIKNAVYRKIAAKLGLTDIQYEEHSAI